MGIPELMREEADHPVLRVTLLRSAPPCVTLADAEGREAEAILRDELLPVAEALSGGRAVLTSYVVNEHQGTPRIVVLGMRAATDAEAEATEGASVLERQGARGTKTARAAASDDEDAKRPRGDSAPLDMGPSTPISDLVTGEAVAFTGRVKCKSGVRQFKSGNGELFDAVLEDASGALKIVAFGDDCRRLFKELSVGAVYAFNGGRLKPADTRFNATGHAFELVCDRDTTVAPAVAQLPPVKYVEIAELRDGDVADVAAVVVTCDDEVKYVSRDGANCTRRSMVVGDQSGERIPVTVFGPCEAREPGDPVAIYGLRVGSWQGEPRGSVGSGEAVLVDAVAARSALEWWESRAWKA